MIDDAIKLISETEKPIKYTYGFKWKNPTTFEVPISKEDAIKRINDGCWAHFNIVEKEDHIDLNMFSSNDMW